MSSRIFLVVNIDEEGDLVQRGIYRSFERAENIASQFSIGLVFEATRCEPKPAVKERKFENGGEKSSFILAVPDVIPEKLVENGH